MTGPVLTADRAEEALRAVDAIFRIAHNIERVLRSSLEPATLAECAVLANRDELARSGWSWDPMGCPTVAHAQLS